MKRLTASLATVILFSLVGCIRVPLEIEPRGDHVKVSVTSMGEYAASVSKIRLLEESSGQVIWDLNSGAKNLGFWDFSLHRGENPVTFDGTIGGQYKVVTPQSRKTFILQGGTTYVLEVWNKSGLRCPTAKFRFVNDSRPN